MRTEDKLMILDIIGEFYREHMYWYDAINPFWGFRLAQFIIEELRRIPKDS